MDENGGVGAFPGRKAAVLWVAGDVLFGLAGTIALSAIWADLFGPREHPGYWYHYYPWAYPIWAYGVTFIKVAFLMVWLGLRFRSAEGLGWLAGLMAGVFLVGAGHALACAIANTEGFGWSPSIGSMVALTYLASLCYLWNFVLALAWGKSSRLGLILGVPVGVGVAAVLPGVMEYLVFGSLW